MHSWTSNGGLTIPERDILLKIRARQAFRWSKPKPCLRWDSNAWCGALEVREGMCSADTCFFRGSTRQRYLLHGADFKRSRNDKRTLNSNKHTSSRTLRLSYPFPSGIDVRGVRLGVRGKRRTRAYRGWLESSRWERTLSGHNHPTQPWLLSTHRPLSPT